MTSPAAVSTDGIVLIVVWALALVPLYAVLAYLVSRRPIVAFRFLMFEFGIPFTMGMIVGQLMKRARMSEQIDISPGHDAIFLVPALVGIALILMPYPPITLRNYRDEREKCFSTNPDGSVSDLQRLGKMTFLFLIFLYGIYFYFAAVINKGLIERIFDALLI